MAQNSITPEIKAPMSNEPFAEGHCLCGAVSYTVNAKPMRMAQCRICKDCQRASGEVGICRWPSLEDDVAILGKTASYPSTADSGNINTPTFVPTCGRVGLLEKVSAARCDRHSGGMS